VLNLAQRESLSLGHNYIGTEHILLGLVRENEGVAARILLDFDADAEKLRNEIIRMLGGPGQRQSDEGFPRGQESGIELGLRRVVPVAQQMSDGTWVVSVEVWDHGLVVRLATSESWPLLSAPELHGWGVSDDLGTRYAQVVGSGGGSPQRGFRFHAEFAPAPPPEATRLLIRRDPTDEELSISLTD
jgi:ClpA/ClpB-like protein